MTDINDQAKRDTPWLAESLRLTLFTVPGAVDVTSKSPLAEILGREPDVRTVQKNGPVVHEQATLEDSGLTLSCDLQARRIDINLVPTIQPDKPLDGFPNAGGWQDAIGAFTQLLNGWIGQAPAALRIAFGVIALLPVESHAGGYRRIQAFLPSVRLDPENSSDFSYTINRPRASRVLGDQLKLNRLSRWSVARFAGVQLEIAGSPGQVTLNANRPDLFACRAQLDINTAPEHSEPLPKEAIADIWNELISLAGEILERGDLE